MYRSDNPKPFQQFFPMNEEEQKIVEQLMNKQKLFVPPDNLTETTRTTSFVPVAFEENLIDDNNLVVENELANYIKKETGFAIDLSSSLYRFLVKPLAKIISNMDVVIQELADLVIEKRYKPGLAALAAIKKLINKLPAQIGDLTVELYIDKDHPTVTSNTFWISAGHSITIGRYTTNPLTTYFCHPKNQTDDIVRTLPSYLSRLHCELTKWGEKEALRVVVPLSTNNIPPEVIMTMRPGQPVQTDIMGTLEGRIFTVPQVFTWPNMDSENWADIFKPLGFVSLSSLRKLVETVSDGMFVLETIVCSYEKNSPWSKHENDVDFIVRAQTNSHSADRVKKVIEKASPNEPVLIEPFSYILEANQKTFEPIYNPQPSRDLNHYERALSDVLSWKITGPGTYLILQSKPLLNLYENLKKILAGTSVEKFHIIMPI